MTKDKLDFTAAKKWCEEIVKNPKAVSASINLAACYLKLVEENEELISLAELLLDLHTDGLIDFNEYGFKEDKDIERFARAVLEKHKEKI